MQWKNIKSKKKINYINLCNKQYLFKLSKNFLNLNKYAKITLFYNKNYIFFIINFILLNFIIYNKIKINQTHNNVYIYINRYLF